MNYLNILIAEETGQDVVEYTLLLAFVAIASAALFMSGGTSINGVWTGANAILTNANKAAS